MKQTKSKFKVKMSTNGLVPWVTLKVKLAQKVNEEQTDCLDSFLRTAIVKWKKHMEAS